MKPNPSPPSPDRPLAIALVTDIYWPAAGGVEQWVRGYSRLLGKRCSVTVIAHARTALQTGFISKTVFLKTFEPYRDDAGNRVMGLFPGVFGRIALLPLLIWYVPFVRRLWAKQVFDLLYFFYKTAFSRRLAALVKGADIVHCFSTGHLAACATDVCKRLGLRLVHSPPVHFDRWGDSPLQLRSYAKADAVLCLSQSFQGEFERRCTGAHGPLVVVPALTVEEGGAEKPHALTDEPFILFLGRRERHKGLAMLCSAVASQASCPALIVAGPGKSVSGPGIVDLGEVTDAQKQWLLGHCELLCVPSEDESFGIVYLEAMRYSRAVVALDVAPVNEIVLNGETGILVSPRDGKALAAALERLLSDRSMRERMGGKGKERYDGMFAPEIVVEKILKVYKEILSPIS
jgi:glycosyltransferase involved in cell wall biosynthesis